MRAKQPVAPLLGEAKEYPVYSEDKQSSRSHRINPDSIHALWFTVVLVGFLAVTSFMVSFAGLQEVAKWVGLPVWLRWAVPVFIDVAILAYSLAALIHRARGEKTWASWVSLAGFTTVSVLANAGHTFMLDHENVWQGWIAAGIAALAPVAVFASTEELGRLVIGSPPGAAPTKPLTDSVTPQLTDFSSAPLQAPASLDELTLPFVQQLEPECADEAEQPSPQNLSVEQLQVEKPVDATRTPVFDALSMIGPHRASLSIVPTPAAENTSDHVSNWIVQQISAGEPVTGKSLGAYLGVSDRTGQKRLKELKDANPAMFNCSPSKVYANQGSR